MYQATIVYFLSKAGRPRVPCNAHCMCHSDTMISLVCARRRIYNERKERDPIFLCTNKNAQLEFAGGMGQLAATKWAQPDELRTTRGSRPVS